MEQLKLWSLVLLISLFSTAVSGLSLWSLHNVGVEAKEQCAEYSKFGKTDKNECHDNYFKSLERNEDGEYTAIPGDLPHMVTLGNSGFKSTCFGSLISENFVLSVAHCTKRLMEYKNGTDFIWASIGINTKTNYSKAVTIKVATTYIHPKYTSQPRANDISLLQLAERVDFDELKRPACINTKKEVDGSNLVAGLGIANSSDYEMWIEAKELENKMKIVIEGMILSKQLGRDGSMSLAMRNPKGKKSSCHEESGTPIINTIENFNCTYNIVGLMTHGETCTQYVTMYTKVSNYVKWIENIVWSHGIEGLERSVRGQWISSEYFSIMGIQSQREDGEIPSGQWRVTLW